MISGERQKPLQKAARWPCGICGRGVGSNSIQCTSCQKWIPEVQWYIGSVTVRHSSSMRRQILRHGTRKGITELLLLVCANYSVQRGHHLAISPHSTLLCIVYFVITHAVFSIVIMSNVVFQHREQLTKFLKDTSVLQMMHQLCSMYQLRASVLQFTRNCVWKGVATEKKKRINFSVFGITLK